MVVFRCVFVVVFVFVFCFCFFGNNKNKNKNRGRHFGSDDQSDQKGQVEEVN